MQKGVHISIWNREVTIRKDQEIGWSKDAGRTPKDGRGKHGNQKKLHEETRESVRQHIRSFPTRVSHYSRIKNAERKYLHENLNERRMWLIYLHTHEPAELEKLRLRQKINPKVKYWLYCDIFNHEFKLSFGLPRSDTCNTCDRLESEIKSHEKNGNEEEANQARQQLDFHHRKAEKGYEVLREMTKTAQAGTIDMLTFDFQQNLPVPTLKNSDMFYARLLWTYNFRIHNCHDGSACMHLWLESIAKRGSSEVCSCLQHYFVTHPPKSRRLVLFSDGCGGQNKNKMMFSYLLRLVKMNVFSRIDHYFLTRGHTFLPNDRDFGVIEKYKKGEMAYVPNDYQDILRKARTVDPFEVVCMEKDDILDYSTFCKQTFKVASLKDLNSNTTAKIRKLMWFSYGQREVFNIEDGSTELVDHGDEIWGRCTLNNMESWMRFMPQKRGANLLADIPKKYADQTVRIKYAKYKDLMEKVVNSGILPDEYKEYYRNLPHDGPTAANHGNGDESDYGSDGDDYVY